MAKHRTAPLVSAHSGREVSIAVVSGETPSRAMLVIEDPGAGRLVYDGTKWEIASLLEDLSEQLNAL